MIFYIVSGLAALWIILVIVLGARSYDGLESEHGWQVMGVIVAWLFFGLGVTSFFQGAMPTTYTDIEKRGLSALATRTDQPGAYFFLGTGVVDDGQVYRYIEVDADGGNRMDTAPIDMSVVYEIAEQPRMETAKPYSDAWWLTPWPVPSLKGSEYRFYVPKGSIVRGYEVTP